MLSPLTGIPILLALNFASFGTLKKLVGVHGKIYYKLKFIIKYVNIFLYFI